MTLTDNEMHKGQLALKESWTVVFVDLFYSTTT